MEYRQVKEVQGLEVTYDGKFKYNGKNKKPTFCKRVTGEKATVRICYMKNGVTHYFQAARLVASAWLHGYDFNSDYLTYKDGDCHNIAASNLVIADKSEYFKYMQRNSGFKGDSLETRKRKLQLVIDEAGMTLHYLKTKDISPVNKHVTDYLYRCLMEYTMRTLHIGETVAMTIVPDALARMYECILNGMCLYNYERFCKQMLLNYKKKGTFGLTGCVPKPIEIVVEQLNLDCLWEKYKVTKQKTI